MRPAVLIAVGVGVIIHLRAALQGSINLDEYQFISNGWNVFRGLQPYRDFWDNHGPAANYVFALPFYFFPAVHDIIIFFRLGAFSVTLLTVAGTVWLARTAYPFISQSGGLAAALLLAAPMYLSKSHEARGDIFLNLAWVWGTGLLFFGLRKNKCWPCLLGGLACGFACWFTPKGLFVIVAGALILLPDLWRRKHQFLGRALGFALGAGLALIALWVWLRFAGLWQPFQQLVLVESIGRKRSVSISPLLGAIKEYPGWMGVGMLIVWKGLFATVRRRPLTSWDARLWPVIIFLIIYYYFLLPSRHLQSLLPLQPMLAVAGVGFLHQGFRRIRRFLRRSGVFVSTLWTLLLVAITVHTLLVTRKSRDVQGYLPQQIASANRWAIAVPPDEMVLRGEGPPLFRPSPLHAYVLVNYLKERYAQRQTEFDIPTLLQAKSVRYVAVEPRIRTLPLRDLEFIRENYLPMAGTQAGPKRMMLAAGKVLRNIADGTTFTIAISSWYWIAREGASNSVKIDGNPVDAGDYLVAGEHWLEAGDSPTTVVVSSVAPKRLDWRSLALQIPPALRE